MVFVKIQDVTVHPPYRNLVPEIKTLLDRRRSKDAIPEVLLTPELFHFLCDRSPILFQNRSESCSECIQGSLVVVGYPNFHTKAMGVQESHGVYEHLALKLRLLLVGLDHHAQTFLFTGLVLFQGLASDQQRVWRT